MSLFIPPTVRATDDNNNAISGAKWYFYLTGTTTLATVYTDDDLTTSATNPVVANGGGLFAPTYLDPAVIYRAILKDASGVQIQDIDPVSRELLTDLAADTGAGLIGTTGGDTVQDEIDALTDKLGSEDFSASPSSGKIAIEPDKTFAGHAAADSDYRVLLGSGKFTGAFGGTQLNIFHAQAEARHTAGTLSFLRGMEAYARLGLQGSSVGSVTSARVFEGHVANESAASAIAAGTVFFANDYDSGDDITGAEGTIGTMAGFWSGDQGHASKVTTAAYGFFAANMTAGAPVTAAFSTAMSSGTGKWSFLATGNAPVSWIGDTRIGDNTVPSDLLEVAGGFAKLTGGAPITTAGNYHEINTSNNDYVAHIKNTHATTPNGIRIRFTGAAPANTTQAALLFEDTVGTRAEMFSNGNWVNANNSYGATSDKRLKTGIRDATPQLDDILALRVRKYKLKADGKDAHEQIGLIAQEVEKVSPGLVFEDGEGTKGIHYSVVNVKLLKALQELAEIVEQQGREIAALKTNAG